MADVTLTMNDLIGILKAHELTWEGAVLGVTEPERRAIIAALERAQRLELLAGRAMERVVDIAPDETEFAELRDFLEGRDG